jgi:BMFP domain-containing protein YqiC
LAKADFLELEKKLQQSIDAHVQRSLAGANAQLRADLEAFVRETVARAVAGEIARLRGSSRGP